MHLERARSNSGYLGEGIKVDWLVEMVMQPTQSPHKIAWQDSICFSGAAPAMEAPSSGSKLSILASPVRVRT